MCGSKGFNNACCPDPQVFKEEFCGNIGLDAGVTTILWTAPVPSDYFQGTFQVFNAGVTTIVATVTSSTDSDLTLTVPPGFTVSGSINNPISFSESGNSGATSKYCVTLYKSIF